MLFADFVIWWYGRGWAQRFADLRTHLSHWAHYFSLSTLLKTLFQPWKQIVSSAGPNGGLAQKRNAFIDNLISRFVGFWVRISVFFFAVFIMFGVFVFNVVYVLAWPLIPLMPLFVIIFGISV